MNSMTRIKVATGTVYCAWERFDGRVQMAWWFTPSGGRETRCLGLTADVTQEEAVSRARA